MGAPKGSKAPTAWKLSNALLDKAAKRTLDGAAQRLQAEWRFGYTVGSDGYTDRAHSSLYNFILHTASCSTFECSVDVGGLLKMLTGLLSFLSHFSKNMAGTSQ
jgi:hypothetical protein